MYCMYCLMTSQTDACSYCMGSKVLCLWTRSSITASCSLLFGGKNWRGKFCVSGNQIKVFVLPHYIRSSNNASMQKQSVSIQNSLDKLTSINMIFCQVFLFENLLHTCLFGILVFYYYSALYYLLFLYFYLTARLLQSILKGQYWWDVCLKT